MVTFLYTKKPPKVKEKVMLTLNLEKGTLNSTWWRQRPSRMWTRKGAGKKTASHSFTFCKCHYTVTCPTWNLHKNRHNTNVLYGNEWVTTSFIVLNCLDIRPNLGITHHHSQSQKAFHKWMDVWSYISADIWRLLLENNALLTFPTS